MEYYDAIVIGAGPAGCSTARALTNDGFKTLLLERERLPREKACGGVVSAEALARVEQRFGPLPPEIVETSFAVAGIKVIRGPGACIELPYSPPPPRPPPFPLRRLDGEVERGRASGGNGGLRLRRDPLREPHKGET